MQYEPGTIASEKRLRSAVDELANQLCRAVNGKFDFAVKVDVGDETTEKLQMLINFVLDAARRALVESESKSEALVKTNRDLEDEIANRRSVEEGLRQAEARMRSIVDNAADGIITIDERGIVESFNRAAEKILGYAAEEILGHNISALMPSPYREEHAGHLQAYLAGAPSMIIGRRREMVGLRKDGSTFPMAVHVSELDSGGHRLFTGIVRDITEHKEAEEKLRQSEERFRDLFDSASDVILSVDAEGDILMINRRAEELTGFTREELGRSNVIRDLLLPDDTETARNILRRLKNGETVTSEVRWKAKDGRVILFETSSSPRLSAEGEFLASRCILRDATERKRAEEALQRAKDELEDRVVERTEQLSRAKHAAEEANQAKSEFLANMSHEIRTPLHGILSYAQFGKEKALTAGPRKLLDYFEKIDTSGQRLLVLLSDILDLAKMESAGMRYEFKPADLRRVLRSVPSEFHSFLADRNITIDYAEPGAALRLTLDENRMAQVVRNLLSNAAKFSPRGGTVRIEVNENREGVRISIRDHGVGIPENELEAVFDKFVQSSKTRSGAGGTGLGLSICREIVEAHQGRIWCENHPEGGAVFHVGLPRKMSSGSPAERAQRAGVRKPDGVTEPALSSGPP